MNNKRLQRIFTAMAADADMMLKGTKVWYGSVPSADINNDRITLPTPKEGITVSEYCVLRAFLRHEMLHLGHTSARLLDGVGPTRRAVLNIFEDFRINRIGEKKWVDYPALLSHAWRDIVKNTLSPAWASGEMVQTRNVAMINYLIAALNRLETMGLDMSTCPKAVRRDVGAFVDSMLPLVLKADVLRETERFLKLLDEEEEQEDPDKTMPLVMERLQALTQNTPSTTSQMMEGLRLAADQTLDLPNYMRMSIRDVARETGAIRANARALRQALMSANAVRYRHRLDDGMVDTKRALPGIAAGTSDPMFMEKRHGKAPRCAVTILLDCSGSMGEEMEQGVDRRDVANSVSAAILEELPKFRGETGAVAFNSRAYVIKPQGRRPPSADELRAVRTVRNSSGTNLEPGVVAAMAGLVRSRMERKVLMVLTDGETGDRMAAVTALELALGFGIEIYSVGIGSAAPEKLPHTKCRITHSAADLVTTMAEMFRDMVITH